MHCMLLVFLLLYTHRSVLRKCLDASKQGTYVCWLRGPVACPQCLNKLTRSPQKIAADILAAAIDAI